MSNLRQVKGKPGLFQIKTAKGMQTIKLVEWKEDYIYDTIEVAVGAIPAGNIYQLFQNLNNKQRVDCNLATMRRLTSGTEMILNQIGVAPQHLHGNCSETTALEFAGLCERLVYELRINSIIITQGPVHCYPPGIGTVGNSASADVVTNGLASQAAIPRLLVPQNLTADNDIQGTLTHSAVNWTTSTYTAPTVVTSTAFIRNTLRGYVKVAVGKG